MIYIIRHGQTAKNHARVLQGRTDLPMNETGIRQAEAARDWFRAQGIAFDRVYASPLVRAVQTAEIVNGKALPVQIDERLIEMDYGPYEGMDLTAPAPEVLAFFMDFAGTPAPEGMEPLPAVVGRLGDFLEEIRGEAQAGNVLIATHAIAMKGALEYLTPDARGSYWSKRIVNCAVYQADCPDGRYTDPTEVEWQDRTQEQTE